MFEINHVLSQLPFFLKNIFETCFPVSFIDNLCYKLVNIIILVL